MSTSTAAGAAAVTDRQVWPEQWAIQTMVEADRLEQQMRVALADCAAIADSADAATEAACRRKRGAEAVMLHLDIARHACTRQSKRRHRRLRDQWRGTQVEQAYRSLHSARVFLVDLVPDAEVDALRADVWARMGVVMSRNDPRRVTAERALQDGDRLRRRVALKQAMETAFDASDDEYTRLRNFRNILLGTAALVIVFVALMAGSAALQPDALPLCFSPDRTSTSGTALDERRVCPSGENDDGEPPRNPSSPDLLIVAGLGAIGAALAALLAVRNLRGSSTPYSIPVALAVLKVPAGALTAVSGMLLLGGEFAPGLSNLDSQRQILAYALVFGYAQQALTGFVDDRAQSMLNKLPSKDPEAKTPEAPVVLPASLGGTVDGRSPGPDGGPPGGDRPIHPVPVPASGSVPVTAATVSAEG